MNDGAFTFNATKFVRLLAKGRNTGKKKKRFNQFNQSLNNNNCKQNKILHNNNGKYKKIKGQHFLQAPKRNIKDHSSFQRCCSLTPTHSLSTYPSSFLTFNIVPSSPMFFPMLSEIFIQNSLSIFMILITMFNGSDFVL